MIFPSRADAGKKLASHLLSSPVIRAHRSDLVVVSLVRGGVPVGHEVARRLVIPHYPLVVKKIGAPGQQELAIGAVCGSEVFLNTSFIQRLELSDYEVKKQITIAKDKHHQYAQKFKPKRAFVKNKYVVVVDDGVATGASVFAACRYLQKRYAQKIYLAVPVAPADFEPRKNPFSSDKCFDEVFVLVSNPHFSSVSQFYRSFPQLSDTQVLVYFTKQTKKVIARVRKN